MNWTEVDFDIAMEVATHEALIRQTYVDSVGVKTWCVGMTNATGHAVERYIGNPQSLQHCMNVYAWALDNYADGVRKAFKGTPLTKAQFAAALSFHWNTGAIGRASWVKHFKAGEIAKARKTFMDWKNPPAVKGRREKERDLFFDGKWSNDGTMLEYTRVTSRMTPDWSSGKRVLVAAELRNAFRRIELPELDTAPNPDNKPNAPTLSPVEPVDPPKPVPVPEAAPRPQPAPTAKPDGKAGIIALAVAALVAAGAWLSGLVCSIPLISNLCG